MRKTSKGVIKMTASGVIPVRKSGGFESFTEENVLKDFSEAAEKSNFQYSFQVVTPLQTLPKISTLGNEIKEIVIKIENFSGISFMMSMPTASPEEQAKFKAWSKFWATLTKFGYNVK
jgi:hypothetical protein